MVFRSAKLGFLLVATALVAGAAVLADEVPTRRARRLFVGTLLYLPALYALLLGAAVLG